jgi:hypothetical protein
MNEFEKILQECLLALERGDSNVDECLRRYPGYASQLRPVLLTSLDLDRGREARPSAAFKTRVRSKLKQEMQVHPRKRARFNFMFMRLATSFATILLALFAAGTAYAQNALPGETFYGWKLASENLWRAVSPDPVETDLALAGRRAAELIAIGNDSEQSAWVLEAYLEVTNRLQLEMDAGNEARIRSILNSQIDELVGAGILLQQPDQNSVPAWDELTPVPTQMPLQTPAIPVVKPTLPVSTSIPVEETIEIIPTGLPKLVPTIEVPPPIP